MLSVLLFAGAVNATGRSLQQPTISSLISKFSDPRDQGVVFGLFHGLGSLARVVGPLIAGFAYPYLNHAGQFVVAGVIAVAMALWTVALRQPAPGEGAPDAVQQGALEA
jgi:MFS family permease